MVQPGPGGSGQGNYNKYRDKFNRCKYSATTKEEPKDEDVETGSDMIFQLLQSSANIDKNGEGLRGAHHGSSGGGIIAGLDSGHNSLNIPQPTHNTHHQEIMNPCWPEWHPSNQHLHGSNSSNSNQHHHYNHHQQHGHRDQGRPFGGGQGRSHFDPVSIGNRGSAGAGAEAAVGRSRHSSVSSEAARISKDEKLAREAGVSFSIDQIVGLPMDEFNDLLSRHDLTEEQLNLCRDIRRRGKNKVAAQNCRKRKIDQIEELQNRLDSVRSYTRKLRERHECKVSQYEFEEHRMRELIHDILVSNNLDPNTFTIQIENGEATFRRKDEVREIFPKPVEMFHLPNFYKDFSQANLFVRPDSIRY